jgi:hypothetical protein
VLKQANNRKCKISFKTILQGFAAALGARSRPYYRGEKVCQPGTLLMDGSHGFGRSINC